jgi:hypothetical protein
MSGDHVVLAIAVVVQGYDDLSSGTMSQHVGEQVGLRLADSDVPLTEL